MTIGNTIGAGILRAPGEVAAQLPTPWLYLGVWVAGGLYALLGAISVAELGAMVPRSGGLYVFVHRALGPYAGFIVGWNDWISTSGSAAAVAIVIGEYSGVLVPALAGRTTAVALVAIGVFTILQWRGVRLAARAQEVTSLLKALALVALVAAAFLLAPAAPETATAAVPTGGALLVSVIIALQAVIYTYDGWTGVIYFSGEVRNPGRDIPRAMFGGVLSIIAIYLLVNLAFLHVLPLPAMAREPFVAGAAATALFGSAGDATIRVLMIVALLSSVNALLMMAPRVLFAMSEGGLVSRRVTAVNAGGTPAPALLVSALVAAAFILTGTFERVIALLAFFFVASYVLAFVSVFVLRAREPETPRPYRAWGYPWTTLLALAGSLAFLIGAVAGDTRRSVIALALVAASYPVYRVTGRAMREG